MERIHFVGIGGISMSALAKLMLSCGAYITGSDDVESAEVLALRKLGIDIKIGSNYRAVEQADLIVYTIAVGEHKDLNLAKKLNKRVLERAEFLAEVSKSYKNVIAVAGTHGKTTTTAMLTNILVCAGLDPTVHIGGNSLNLNSNLLIGGQEYFITEACEFNKSFLKLTPDYSIITNIEQDHLDTYKNLDEIDIAFNEFMEKTTKKVVINADYIDDIQHYDKDKYLTFGLLEKGELCAKRLTQRNGKYSFDVFYKDKKLCRIKNNILGEHNIQNALACVGLCLVLGIDIEFIKQGIESFKGVERRLTLLKTKNGVKHYQDYAHHPTEIKTLLQTLKLIKKGRIIAIFQPHTYTRTFALMQDFVQCFDDADFLYILPTYSAREAYLVGGDATDLFYNLGGRINCQYCSNFESLSYELDKMLELNDICIWIGAGDIYQIAKKYLENCN